MDGSEEPLHAPTLMATRGWHRSTKLYIAAGETCTPHHSVASFSAADAIRVVQVDVTHASAASLKFGRKSCGPHRLGSSATPSTCAGVTSTWSHGPHRGNLRRAPRVHPLDPQRRFQQPPRSDELI